MCVYVCVCVRMCMYVCALAHAYVYVCVHSLFNAQISV